MKDQIEKLKSALQELRETGAETIPIELATAHLDELLKHRTFHPLNVATATEIFKAAVSAGEQAIKSALLLAIGALRRFLHFLAI